ncbi:helix-turn-helix domain-containing protein [Qipengyuania gaetbuli]|uniref:helix-turn-helix domain-containing protein n=1 Tax=Qipengyuania gaetbuli TaxID=266952 RepID=UPI00299D6A70|nr:helix-turn-helix domain-containing protein [Qipengyuania gaetbuli]
MIIDFPRRGRSWMEYGMLSDDLIKGAEAAAKYLGLKRKTVYDMVRDATIPYIRKGRCLYFRKSELDASFRS